MTRCLIIGSALNWREDLDNALALSEFDAVIAVKAIGGVFRGPLAAWATLHPHKTALDIPKRLALGYSIPPIYSNEPHPIVTNVVEYKYATQRFTGSSGLFAVKVALDELKYTRNVLCGIPLDSSYGRIGADEGWMLSRVFEKGLREMADIIRPKTRSMSGLTQQVLGSPTASWINERA